MLQSQIKLTSYDFTDLHITGKFDNRPGTGRFFSCVVTYRTGAGRRLYMITSYGARPGIGRCYQIRRCKRSAGHPFVARSILHKFSRAMMDTFISQFATIPPNIYFCLYMFLVFRSRILMQMQYVLQNHVASHRWQFDSLSIGWCPGGHGQICLEMF